MEESILTPILIGIAINAALFLITRYAFKKDFMKSTLVTLIAAVVVFISSFIIGSWFGMGIGVISLGMFICTIVLFVLSFTQLKTSKS